MYYSRLLPVLLPLLLTVAFNGVPIFVMANVCSSGHLVREGTMRTIATIKNTKYVNEIEMKPNVYVFPLSGGFQGVSLVAEDGSGRNHTAWFPMSRQPQHDHCSTRVKEWVEMKMGAQILTKSNSFQLYFWLRYGGCIKACYGSSTEARSLRSLSVVGHSYFIWRDTTPTSASCMVRRLSPSTTSDPEPYCQNLSPQGQVTSPPTTTHHPPQRPASSTSPPPVTPTPCAPTADRGSSVVMGCVVGVLVVVAIGLVVTNWWCVRYQGGEDQ